MVATRLMTAEQFANAALTASRSELIDGEVLETSPTGGQHVYVTGRIAFALYQYMVQMPGMFVGIGEGGYLVGRNPDSVLAPDIAVCLDGEGDRLVDSGRGFIQIIPSIVIEVKSPSDREADIARRASLYMNAGVREIWWVRPEDRQITIHRPDRSPEVIAEPGAITSTDLLRGFSLALVDVFMPKATSTLD